MKTIDKIITKVSGKYGAPMGRINVGLLDDDMKTYQIVYSFNGREVGKTISAESLEAAEEKANDVVMFPIECNDYNNMEITVYEEGMRDS